MSRNEFMRVNYYFVLPFDLTENKSNDTVYEWV